MSSVGRVIGSRERLECQECGGHDVVVVKDICNVDECESEIFAKRLCKRHYNRAYRLLKQKQHTQQEYQDFWKQVDQFTKDRRRV